MAINWSFISQKGVEGESTYKTGYVPAEGSGFTVGSLDVGQHSREDLRTMLQSYSNKLAGSGSNVGVIRQDLLDKISPYVKGSVSEYGTLETRDLLAKRISFKEENIKYLTEAKRHQFTKTLSDIGKYKTKEGKIIRPWNQLDKKTQTILASVGWQYGADSPEFRALYKLRNDKKDMGKQLRIMGSSNYEFRRNKEADHIDPLPLPIQETLNVDKNKEMF